MKKLILLALAAFASLSSAATIGITSGTPAQTVKLSNGNFISTTAWIRVGFFVGGDTAGLSEASDAVLATIQSKFVPIGESTSAAGYGTVAGNSLAFNPANSSLQGAVNDVTFGSGTANTVVTGNIARGTRLYLLIYDQKVNPTELGIFSATNWTVPTSTLVNTANLTLTGVDTAGEVFRGTLGSLVLAPITVVPEPTTSVMALLAGLGLISRRRR